MTAASETPATPGGGIDAEWFAEAFDALYPMVYAHRSVERARAEVAFAASRLGITENDTVLDLGCGAGRHLLHMREHTPWTVGLDYSMDLLRAARANLGPRARLVHGDMRHLPVLNGCDVAVNFFTSFGYFMSDAENLAVVKGLAAALRPGGRFLIDYFNAAHTRANLVPESERHSGSYQIRERRWIDDDAGRVNKQSHVFERGKLVRSVTESVRLYREDAFRALLTSGGLVIEACYGNFAGDELAPDRPRMIAVGHKA